MQNAYTPESSNPLDDLMQSLTSIGSSATMVVKDAEGQDMIKMLQDRVYGLLSEEKLTVEQIELLSVMLKALTARP